MQTGLLEFFDGNSLPSLSNLINYAGFLAIVAGAFVVIKSRATEQAHKATLTLKEQLDGELKLKEKQLSEAKNELKDVIEKMEKLESERDLFRTGYTALSGINITELLNVDKITRERDAYIRQCDSLHAQLVQVRVELKQNATE